MNKLASKSKDRRADWISHTLDVLAQDINAGGKRELDQAKTIARGKSAPFHTISSLICDFLWPAELKVHFVASFLLW